jgi:hypothetical protein
MRALFWLLMPFMFAAARAALAQTGCPGTACPQDAPVELQFDLTVDPSGANIWNGPGPMPTHLQETFFVDPASAAGHGPGGVSFVSHDGILMDKVSVDFAASNVSLTADGLLLQQLPSGTFSFSGDRVGLEGLYFGGLSLPNGGAGADFITLNPQVPPDWAAFLSPSIWFSDGPGFLQGPFGQLSFQMQGQGQVVSAPEPGILALCALGGLALFGMHRRRRTR